MSSLRLLFGINEILSVEVCVLSPGLQVLMARLFNPHLSIGVNTFRQMPLHERSIEHFATTFMVLTEVRPSDGLLQALAHLIQGDTPLCLDLLVMHARLSAIGHPFRDLQGARMTAAFQDCIYRILSSSSDISDILLRYEVNLGSGVLKTPASIASSIAGLFWLTTGCSDTPTDLSPSGDPGAAVFVVDPNVEFADPTVSLDRVVTPSYVMACMGPCKENQIDITPFYSTKLNGVPIAIYRGLESAPKNLPGLSLSAIVQKIDMSTVLQLNSVPYKALKCLSATKAIFKNIVNLGPKEAKPSKKAKGKEPAAGPSETLSPVTEFIRNRSLPSDLSRIPEMKYAPTRVTVPDVPKNGTAKNCSGILFVCEAHLERYPDPDHKFNLRLFGGAKGSSLVYAATTLAWKSISPHIESITIIDCVETPSQELDEDLRPYCSVVSSDGVSERDLPSTLYPGLIHYNMTAEVYLETECRPEEGSSNVVVYDIELPIPKYDTVIPYEDQCAIAGVLVPRPSGKFMRIISTPGSSSSPEDMYQLPPGLSFSPVDDTVTTTTHFKNLLLYNRCLARIAPDVAINQKIRPGFAHEFGSSGQTNASSTISILANRIIALPFRGTNTPAIAAIYLKPGQGLQHFNTKPVQYSLTSTLCDSLARFMNDYYYPTRSISDYRNLCTLDGDDLNICYKGCYCADCAGFMVLAKDCRPLDRAGCLDSSGPLVNTADTDIQFHSLSPQQSSSCRAAKFAIGPKTQPFSLFHSGAMKYSFGFAKLLAAIEAKLKPRGSGPPPLVGSDFPVIPGKSGGGQAGPSDQNKNKKKKKKGGKGKGPDSSKRSDDNSVPAFDAANFTSTFTADDWLS
jgi:hypothetical protein